MRDLRIDTLRGFFLLIVTMNHLPISIKESLKRPLGFISTAEGFVFISGLVAGIVYFPKWLEGNRAETKSRILKRAGQIYLCHLLIFLILWILVNSPGTSGPYLGHFLDLHRRPVGTLLSGFALIYQPYLVDILPMYCLFLAVTPGILALFEKGKAPWVLGLSFILYGVAQIPSVQRALHETYMMPLPIRLSHFNILAWQLLFIIGLYFGCLRSTGALKLALPPRAWVPCLLFCELCFAFSRGLLNLSPSLHGRIAMLFERRDIGILRLLSFFAFTVLVSLVVKALNHRIVLRPLALLGRYPLSVFTWGILLTLLFWPLFRFMGDSQNYAGLALLGGLIFGSLWIPPLLQEARRGRMKKMKTFTPSVKTA